MREAIGGLSIFQIVILFILLFTGIMCLTINHSKAFGVKDEIINIIETDVIPTYTPANNYQLDDATIEDIRDYLNEAGHRITGKCPDGYRGYSRTKGDTTEVTTNASFCIKAVNVVDNAFIKDAQEKCKHNKCTTTNGDYPSMVYYEVVLFYQLDIPVINYFTNFKLQGATKVLFG